MPDADTAQTRRGRTTNPRPRVAFYDTLRGFTIVSMCAFHVCYDLAYLYGLDMSWFTNVIVQDLWRDSISFTFLILAGWMTSFSRDNFRRAGIYALTALIVWVATTIAAVDTPVSFGILYCMAACTFIWACLWRFAGNMLENISTGALGFIRVILIASFVATCGVYEIRYPFEGLAWLGFPSASFASGDYYPLIPYLFLYLLGAFGALRYRQTESVDSTWMLRDWCRPLTVIGRHSLIVYLVHQPIALLVLQLILG